jgi:hypothetical protein
VQTVRALEHTTLKSQTSSHADLTVAHLIAG